MPVAVASCSIVRRSESSGMAVNVPACTVTANDVTSMGGMLLEATTGGGGGGLLGAVAPAGGAPLGQVIGATAAGLLLTAGLYTLGRLHRAGGTRVLDLAAAPF